MIEDNLYPFGEIKMEMFRKGCIIKDFEYITGFKRYKIYKDGILFFNRADD